MGQPFVPTYDLLPAGHFRLAQQSNYRVAHYHSSIRRSPHYTAVDFPRIQTAPAYHSNTEIDPSGRADARLSHPDPSAPVPESDATDRLERFFGHHHAEDVRGVDQRHLSGTGSRGQYVVSVGRSEIDEAGVSVEGGCCQESWVCWIGRSDAQNWAWMGWRNGKIRKGGSRRCVGFRVRLCGGSWVDVVNGNVAVRVTDGNVTG